MSTHEDTPTPHLLEALKAKGIGPHGNRGIETELLRSAIEEIASGKAHPALAAAFLTAFRVLDQSEEEEKQFAESCELHASDLSHEIQLILGLKAAKEGNEVERIVEKLIEKTDLNEQECKTVIDTLFDEQVADTYKAAMLQGLRVKRESDNENLHLYRSLLQSTDHTTSDLKNLIDLADPYDGFKRMPCLTPYVGLLLNAIGAKVVLHGTKGLGPKYGETSVDVLANMGAGGPLGAEDALLQLQELGITCLEQESAYPKLASLKPLRNAMIKRPFLATFEKLLMPIRSRQLTMVSGYVHKAYRTSIPKMLMKTEEPVNVVWVKGLEGSVIMDPDKKVDVITANPENGLKEEIVSADKKTLEVTHGVEDFLGKHSGYSDTVVFTAAEIAYQSGIFDRREEACEQVKIAISSGNVLQSKAKFLDSLQN